MTNRPISAEQCLTIWRFVDGKPGHEKQTLGLCSALHRLVPCRVLDIPVTPDRAWPWKWLMRRFPTQQPLPDPDLLIGAGHATHVPMLAARRARGGRIVVLMRPSLPLAWFDLCLIPEHDSPPARTHVLITRGALNPVTASDHSSAPRGLILVGGPSSHYSWDDADVVEQIRRVVVADADVPWVLTTSRRTPATFTARLGNIPALKVVPWQETGSGWLEQQLAESDRVWVSPDSVSMVYESLTAGCRVGLLQLAPTSGSRVARGIKQLVQAGYATPLDEWLETRSLKSPPERLDEAGRIAGLIIERWFTSVR